MGLLKLGSLYKKKSNKKEKAQQQQESSCIAISAPSVPKLEPISLDLNLDLNNHCLDTDIHSKVNDTTLCFPKKAQADKQQTTSYGLGSSSLFDDIFAELDGGQKDSIQTDISLALALSHQLQLEQEEVLNSVDMKKTKDNNKENKASNILLNSDSIYSSYLNAPSATNHSESLSTSMFDSLLNKDAKTSSPSLTTFRITVDPKVDNNNTKTPVVTQTVLDSDVSDTDDESKISSVDYSDQDVDAKKIANNSHSSRKRMTKGVQPIMERRRQDNEPLVQRKVDNWTHGIEPDSDQVESMIERMKDRHRNQAKLAALRQQELFHTSIMMRQQRPFVVPQAYGPLTVTPLSTNHVVLPHPGSNRFIDSAQQQQQMYYCPMIPNDLPDITQQMHQHHLYHQHFIPNASYSKKEDYNNTLQQRQSVHQLPPLRQSKSTPVRQQPTMKLNKLHLPPPAANHRHINDSQADTSTSSIPFTLSNTTLNEQQQSGHIELEEDKNSMKNTSFPEAPNHFNEFHAIEDETIIAAEADIESNDDDDDDDRIENTFSSTRKRKSQTKRKSSRQKGGGGGEGNVNQQEIINTNYLQNIRSSISVPNLKKIKQVSASNNKKGKSKSSSNRTSNSSNSSSNSSRQTAQGYSTAAMSISSPTETLPIPPPLPISYQSPHIVSAKENHHYNLQQHHYQQLRPMKSEPDFTSNSSSGSRRKSHNYKQQQQQQDYDWERLCIYQREQQYQDNLCKTQNRHMSHIMPMHAAAAAPIYYPVMSSSSSTYNNRIPNEIGIKDPHHDLLLYNRGSFIGGYQSNTMIQQPFLFR
ncbi:uncharacterized protein BX663DRAFT_564964 [Cokeromyces recurvatus]|uniref:uncharacterized protein n=1 Tax=Cokeromyces recurvatus TaxID=90255 RepID=UPI002220306A|nr:uncharacterized protein BX663DRAFT_564964 [Cokeromyces recurvatus]KAI7898164.1 hypothetical protein BX663DRAFT_564964 [Cokeromyces recurvatus]